MEISIQSKRSIGYFVKAIRMTGKTRTTKKAVREIAAKVNFWSEQERMRKAIAAKRGLATVALLAAVCLFASCGNSSGMRSTLEPKQRTQAKAAKTNAYIKIIRGPKAGHRYITQLDTLFNSGDTISNEIAASVIIRMADEK